MALKPAELAAQALADLERVEAGEMEAAAWVAAHARPVTEGFRDWMRAIPGISEAMGQSSRMLRLATETINGMRLAAQQFKRTTGLDSHAQVKLTQIRWLAAVGLARIVEARSLGFFQQIAKMQPGAAKAESPPEAKPVPTPEAAAQKLADVVSQARQAVPGPAAERFAESAARIRRRLLKNRAVEDAAPTDGGKLN